MKKLLTILLLYSLETIVYPKTDDIQVKSICEGEISIELGCPENKAIFIDSVTRNDVRCKIANDKMCSASLTRKMMQWCHGRNNCTISQPNLFDNCKRRPRFLSMEYGCSCNWIRTFSAEVCSDSLSDVNCYKFPFTCWKSWFDTNLVSSKVKFYTEEEAETTPCSNCEHKTLERLLVTLCDQKEACTKPPDSEFCLYHRNRVSVKYQCLAPSKFITYSSVEYATSALTTPFSTDNPNVFSTSAYASGEELYTTTFSPPEIRAPSINLDENNRVLVYDHSRNLTVSICATEWDSKDATVICKYFNKSSFGREVFVTNEPFYRVAPVLVNCFGNESTPFNCDLRDIGDSNNACNTSQVAAVLCCTDKNCRSETSQISGLTETEIIIAVTVVAIVIVSFSVAVICFLRRTNKCRRKKYSTAIKTNRTDDYIGGQSVALPTCISEGNAKHALPKNFCSSDSNLNKINERTTSLSNKHLHTDSYAILDPIQTGYNRSKDGNNVYEYAKSEDEQVEQREDVNASATDGLYDIANDKRHNICEQTIYSRSTDMVYDHTDHIRKAEINEETYDHCFGKVAEDNYNPSTRT